MNYNTLFNTNGKIPTWSDFFKGEGADVFTSKNGIVDGFKTVLGEQIIHTRLPYRTPIYSLGISAPSPLKKSDHVGIFPFELNNVL